MLNTFLNRNEVVQLTNRKNRPSQEKVLNIMGINHKVTPDGEIKILRSHIIKEFDGDLSAVKAVEPVYEPNWNSINA